MKIKFTEDQLNRLSEYFSNLSLLVLGTVVIPQIIGISKLAMFSLIFGLIATFIFVVISLVLIK